MLRPRPGNERKDELPDRDPVHGLPLEDYLEFVNLVKGVKMAVAYNHTKATVDAPIFTVCARRARRPRPRRARR